MLTAAARVLGESRVQTRSWATRTRAGKFVKNRDPGLHPRNSHPGGPPFHPAPEPS